MASRGVKNKLGFVTDNEYSKVEGKDFLNASELFGNNGNHGLPDYSHTPNRIYVKTDSRGFREMRVYDYQSKVVLEIAHHPEKSLTGNRKSNVLHYHFYDADLKRTKAIEMDSLIYNEYKQYLNFWGMFWNETK